MTDDSVFAALCGFLAIVAVITVVVLVVTSRAESRCLAAGYPQSNVDWKLNTYCIKRVDQTDVVVPLKNIQR